MSEEFIAYLSPPVVEAYQHYPDYLQDFRHFLEFLDKHPKVASIQTRKRPSLPSGKSLDKTLLAIRNKIPKRAEEIAGSSDSDDWTPPSTVRGQDDFVNVDHGASHKPTLSNPKIPVLPGFEDRPLLQEQIGKKKAMVQIKLYCSDGLANALVEKNRVSRAPNDFAKLVAFLASKSKRKGRKLDQQDVNVREVDKPDPPDNKCRYVDFEAMWNSAEDI